MKRNYDIAKQSQTPLYDVLVKYQNQYPANFHVPGHKQGKAFLDEGNAFFKSVLQIDVTEVSDLDDLHHPSGAIVDAQKLAAEAFGADHTFFLVGGSTAGNIASILHLCRAGDSIIIQRTCHQSVFHGCMLAGAHPIYLNSSYDPDTGFETILSADLLEQLLQQNPNTKAVVITSPNYYGLVQPVQLLAKVCHKYGIPLVVDEAHGAHFGFHPDLPFSAMDEGADLVVQSTHKMLTSMTMSSMLHVKRNKCNIEEIQQWLRMIQSSSPSYPLMASLDLARKQIACEGLKKFNSLLPLLQCFRDKLKVKCKFLKEIFIKGQDPCKLTIVSLKKISGQDLARDLEQDNIIAELSDHNRVLFVFSMGTTQNDLSRLLDSLEKLDQEISSLEDQDLRETMKTLPNYGGQNPVSIMDIVQSGKERIPLKESVGRVAADLVVPYPPGIPLVLPGELITFEILEYLTSIYQSNSHIRGVETSHKVPYIYVKKEK